MPVTKAKMRQAILELDAAAQDFAFKGASPPSAHEYIQARYDAAKLRLLLYTGVAAETKANIGLLHQLDMLVEQGCPPVTDQERGG